MNLKEKLVPKKKVKFLPRTILATPKKSLSRPLKERVPPTMDTTGNIHLSATLKKIMRSPSMKLSKLTAENRDSLISMLITESSNVSLDSPILTQFSAFHNEDEQLLTLVKRCNPGINFQTQVGSKDEAAIKIQRMWRWWKTMETLRRFMTKAPPMQEVQVQNQDLDAFIHTQGTGSLQQHVDAQLHASISAQRYLPKVDAIRLSDIQHLISDQSALARKKYLSEFDFAKEQFSMDIISRQEYIQEVHLCEEALKSKQVELNQYSELVRKVTGDIRITLGIMAGKAINRSHSSQKPISRFQYENEVMLIKNRQTYKHKRPRHKGQVALVEPQSDQEIQKQIQDDYRLEIKKEVPPQLEPPAVRHIGVDQETVELTCKMLLRFALNSPSTPFQRLNTPLGMTPQQLLRAYSQSQGEIPNQIDVLPGKLFEQFQKAYLKDVQQKASKEGKSLPIQIKRYIHYHNEAIFDAVNEALEFQRRYGIKGHPLPWKVSAHSTNPNLQKSIISVIDYILDCQECQCGFLPQNFYSVNPDLPYQYLVEIRSQKLMMAEVLELRNEVEDWTNYDVHQTFMLMDVQAMVMDVLLAQFQKELGQLA